MFSVIKCRSPQSIKVIEYYGIKLTIPDDHHWIATDSDGDVYSYTHKPEPCNTGCWQPPSGDSLYLCNVEHTGEWSHSLIVTQIVQVLEFNTDRCS